MNEPNNSFLCPFCNSSFPLIDSTYRYNEFCFNSIDGRSYRQIFDPMTGKKVPAAEEIIFRMYKCPSCNEVTSVTKGIGERYTGVITNIYPKSQAKQFPDYIPEQTRQDYEEAYAIVNLSPKASATLSRRALQGMIRDFHGISKPRLIDEIKAISENVTPSEKKVLDSIRDIGNIGAHPERDINLIVDIESGEAEKLLKVIEYFVKSWYITRHEAQQLFIEVNDINEKFQKKRKSGK
ncbi:MAG: DUF4145 domain-containing protein [Lactococcus lactis]|nr:DUF4145 domain-containing protein [Lactococcus lactis]